MPKRPSHPTPRSSTAEYLTYASALGTQNESLELRYEDENLWLTQKFSEDGKIESQLVSNM